jgi:hypothetical protein
MRRLATFWSRKSSILLLTLVGSAFLDGCKREFNREPPMGSAALPSRPIAAASATSLTKRERSISMARAKVESTVLVSLPLPAYHKPIYLDGEATYLLTDRGAYRLLPNQKPQELRGELGFGAVLTHSAFVYWAKGAVWRAPKDTGKPQRLAAVGHQPQFFVSSEERFAWVDRSEEGRFSIQTIRDRKVQVIYAPYGTIDAATMIHDWVFFVERAEDATWRLGGISLAGGVPAFTPVRKGRTPAMLTTADDLYYYDINTSEIHAISPDFQHERTIAKDVVCSPMAVSKKMIYCGRVEGLTEVDPTTHAVQLLEERSKGPITAIAVDGSRVVWVSDTGQANLTVSMLSTLPVPSGGADH